LAEIFDMQIIGRQYEIAELLGIYESSKAELVAVIGRRRVGKTYLIRNYFAGNISFEFTGMYKGSLGEHMERFAKTIGSYFYQNKSIAKPKNWYQAFDMLQAAIQKMRSKKKKVIFLDELPWMGTSHISFKNAFGLFWNTFASTRSDIVVIFSGSSTAWIHNKIFKDRGGLFQRVTRRIHLAPFTLHEAELFIKSKNIIWNKQSVLDAYMVFGGIPFYLDLIKPAESVAQTIDRLLFRSNAELRTEFDELFKSLFDDIPVYKNLVDTLAKHPQGLYRNDLLKKLKTTSGGQITSVLEELAYCGFISTNATLGNKNKAKKYQLTDAYTLFYLKFVKANREQKKWAQLSKTQAWTSWSGIAFENVCKQHIVQIKEALRIGAVLSEHGSWYHKGNAEMKGAQIDLLIDRDDKVITICEMKYYNTAVTITKEMASNLRQKIASFRHFTQSKKSIMLVVVAPYGVAANTYSQGLLQGSIDIDDLFCYVKE
jgi:uncharacterized protein